MSIQTLVQGSPAHLQTGLDLGVTVLASDNTFVLTAPLLMKQGSRIAGSAIRGVVLDGASMPNPIDNWYTGVAPGIALIADASASPTTPFTNLVVDNVQIKNTPSGGVVWQNIADCDIGRLDFANVQTYAEYAKPSALEVHTATRLTIGKITLNGYKQKGVSLSYCKKTTVDSLNITGGSGGDAAVYVRGGDGIRIGSIVHDGAGAGYGPKIYAARNLMVSQILGKSQAGGLQVYASHGRFDSVKIENPLARGIELDAWNARSGELASEMDVSFGDVEITRTSTSSNIDHASVSVRTDGTTGAVEMKTVHFGRLRMSGGWSGIFNINHGTGGLLDWFIIDELDVGNLHASGFPATIKAKNILIRRAIIRAGVSNGMIFYTDEDNRGGECIIENVVAEPGLTTSEPLIRVGYPGSTFEGGFRRVSIENVVADGGANASTWLIDLNLNPSGVDECSQVSIAGVRGVRYARSEAIRVAFNASTTRSPILTLDDISVTNASGVQLGLTVENGQMVAGGSISGVRTPITGRPTKCTPYYYADSVVGYDPPSVASGAFTAARTVAVPGAASGDSVAGTITDGTLSLDVAGVVSSAGNVTFMGHNPTAATLNLASGSRARIWVTPKDSI